MDQKIIEKPSALEKYICQKHKSEQIQRISDSVLSSSPLYCLECIVENNRAGVYDNLLKLDEYIKFVCESSPMIESEEFKEAIPTEISELFEKESSVIEQLKAHIEKEKQKVATFFNAAQEKALKVLEEYKNAVFYGLDKQIESLAYNFGLIRRSAHKWFDNTPSEYYNKPEELLEAIQSQESTQALEIFIKHLNREMAEVGFLMAQEGRANRESAYIQGRDYVKSAFQELKDQVETLPIIKVGDEMGSKVILEHLERMLLALLKDSINLENIIQEFPPLIKHNDSMESHNTSKIRKEKVFEPTMSAEKFNSKLQRLKGLLNDTSLRIGSPGKFTSPSSQRLSTKY